MNYTKNNYLKIYANKFGGHYFEYSNCTEDLKSYKEEVLNSAKLISEQLKNKKIALCYSGGADSHVMLLSFLELKIDFTVAILKISYGSQEFINKHETQFAINFCNQNYIDYKIYNIDLKTFWNPVNLVKFTDPYMMNCPVYAVHMWLTSEIVSDGNSPIFGEGRMNINYDKKSNQYYIRHLHGEFSLHNFYLKNNIKGIRWFHNYTPEQTLSYFNELICEYNIIREQVQTGPGKLYTYSKHFPIQQQNVFTGFESIYKKKQNMQRFLYNRYGRLIWEILLTDLLKILEKPK